MSIYKKPWYLYIAQCRDQTLYVGVARDVQRRIHEHNHTKRCKYTRSRQPVELVYKKRHASFALARKREVAIKKFTREKKLELIKSA